MIKPVADSDARAQAINPGCSYIVQAPAGSGKTGLLIQRYLKLLSLVDSPEEIVAITFTRKAAAEMQNRILAAISQAGSDIVPETDHEKITYRLARAALARNEQLGWALTENPSRMRIQTIDALCAVITRQMPVYSKLGAQPETLDDAEPVYEQAAINTIGLLENAGQWTGALATLLSHLDNDLPRVKTLLIDMLRKRDQWLPHVTQVHQREQLEQALVNLIEDKLKTLCEILPQHYETDLCTCISYAAKNLQQEAPEHVINICSGLANLPGDSVTCLPQWQAIAELLLTKTDNSWRKRIDKTTGFPAASANKLNADERARMKKQLLGLIDQLKKTEGLQNLLAEIKSLPPAHYTDQEWEVIHALCKVLTLVAAQLNLIFAEKNRIDFNGITQAALEALGNLDNPSDLAFHLDYRINHLLVDEFQDISITQFNLLQGLTTGWSQGDGHSLFLVGDPQQSIYRFREAEVGLFINTVAQQRLGQVPLVPLSLTVNFRSQQGIVHWINECFTNIFPETADVTTGAVAYSPSLATHQDTQHQHVNIYPQFGNQKNNEAGQIIEVIRTIRDSEAESTIAILVRSRTHLVEIIPLMKQHRFRFQAIEIESLANQPAIQDLSSLTRAYLHPADRIAWLAVLRAPWCGLDLMSMHALFNDKGKTIWEALQQQDLTLHHNPVSQTHLHHLISVFKQAFENKQRRTLRQTIETLWYQLGGPATLGSDNDLENATTFLDLLEQLDSGGDIEDLDQLQQEIAGLYAATDRHAGPELQIMTIHKAKGLEFDHVIIPGLGRVSRYNQPELLAWLLRPRENSGQDLILGPIREAGQAVAPIYQYLSQVDKEKQRYEDARLIYVALTRAKKSLHLISHAGIKLDEKTGELYCKPASRSLLNHLWPMLNENYNQVLPGIAGDKDNGDNIEPGNELNRLAGQWQLPQTGTAIKWESGLTRYQPDISQIEFEWAGETIRQIGSVAHRYIQLMAEQGLAGWDESSVVARRNQIGHALSQAGVPAGELEIAVNQVTTALVNMRGDERGQWILHAGHGEAHNEFPVSGVYQGKLVNIIIDRTFIDQDGHCWIIDYKTSTHEGPDLDTFLDLQQERYQEQMKKYATLMLALGAEKIRLGLYFPILKGWREWEFS